MNTAGVVVVGIVGALVGFGVGAIQFLSKEPGGASKLESENATLKERLAVLEAAASQEKSATLDTSRHTTALEFSLESTKAELTTAQAQLAATKKRLDDLTAAAAMGDAAAGSGDPKKARFLLKGYEEGLGVVDWAAVGSNMNSMLPLLVELGAGLAKGQRMEQMSPEMIGRIQQHNGPLVTVALKLQGKAGFGTDPNGAFTHPAFMVNAIATTLEAAHLPLSDAQAAALEQVGKDYADAEARRVAGYDEHAYQLQKTVDEAELKDRFFEAAFAVLTQEQRDALSPAATRGRVQVDLFSSGLIWAGRMSPVLFRDADALVTQIQTSVVGLLNLDDKKRVEARAVVADWVNGLPKAWKEEVPDALSRQGMVPASRAIEAAKRDIVLLQRLVETLHLDAATEALARADSIAAVPVHLPP